MQLAGIGMNNVGATTINGVCIHLPRLMPAVGRVAGSSYSFLDRRAVRYWLQTSARAVSGPGAGRSARPLHEGSPKERP